MTEPNADVADRLAKLRERRGQSPAETTPPTSTPAPATARASTSRRRRISPAGGAKIVVAGASATAVLGLVAAYGWNDHPAAAESTSAPTPTVPPIAASAPVVAAPVPLGAAPTAANPTSQKVVVVVVEAPAAAASTTVAPGTIEPAAQPSAPAAAQPSAPAAAAPAQRLQRTSRSPGTSTGSARRPRREPARSPGTPGVERRKLTVTHAVEAAPDVVTFTGVMSCRGRVLVAAGGVEPAPSAERAVNHLEQLEQRWSRFLPTSEISRLNAAGGEPTEVSGDTVTLVERLIEAHALTGGAFDPTLLRPIVELGYGASRSDARNRSTVTDDVTPRGLTSGIVVDRHQNTITLPPGTALDPGGLGKGLAADLVVDRLMRNGASGCLVEVGGDLRVSGDAPGGNAWTIAIDGDDEPPLLLASGGLATSSSQRRTWQRDGQLHHHLLDPATLRPTDHGVVECSVAVGSAAHAEALTKVAFVTGLADGVGFYADRGIAARIVDADGSIVTTPAWRDLQGATR